MVAIYKYFNFFFNLIQEKACILEGKEYAHIAGEKAKYLETAYFP